ncbi:MAG: FAD-binding oxidoreductase [Hyphomicrobium sp.]
MTELSGWGRYPRHDTRLLTPDGPEAALSLQAKASGWIARGNGRSYGDAAIGITDTLMMRGLGRMTSFDPDSGRLTAEAGTLLADILAVFLPRGFFPPVVPGTKFVTLGGMVAADVHGKNHHRDGGFGRHVESLRLALPDGSVVTCSREENAELLDATIGGMGLTGSILDVTFRLSPIETGWMRHKTVVAANLDTAMAALQDANDAHYSVAWIDCLAEGQSLGRSLIYRAEHASRDDVVRMGHSLAHFPGAGTSSVTVPLDFPGFALNRLSVRAFNELYFRQGAAAAGPETLVGWDPFFFPLDGIHDWNRIYGRRGFVQHQCVIPPNNAREVLVDILTRIARQGNASFLAVLKTLGPGDGLISFPMPGYTLALDFSFGPRTLALLEDIDRVVSAAGGRIYLAKDARQSRATFEAGYAAALPKFRELRRKLGAETRIASHLSQRLGL